MRIATWNVNSLNARMQFVVDWLKTRDPDIVCLQELKLTEEAFPFEAFEELGYHAAICAQKSWNGVAVIAKEPVEQTQVGLPGAEEAGARLVSANVAGITVTSVYIPNGKFVEHDDFPKKLAWLESFCDYASKLIESGLPLIIGGDFNLCPADIDSHDPVGLAGHIFHTDEERACYERILDLGLVDMFRNQDPQTPGFSWWDYRSGQFHKNNGLRIDLLFATPNLAEKVTHVGVDRDFRKKREGLTPSDHAPVIVDLAFAV